MRKWIKVHEWINERVYRMSAQMNIQIERKKETNKQIMHQQTAYKQTTSDR